MKTQESKIFCFDTYFQEDKTLRDKTIYHYTSPEALASILSNTSIRFTDCQFMNDRSEYNHILEPLEAAVRQVEAQLHDSKFLRQILKQLGTNFQTAKYEATEDSNGHLEIKMTPSRYYLFCASTGQDSLNMWNYYVKNGSYQGYNIGLSTLEIVKNIKNSIVDSILFGRVIYDSRSKTALLSSLLIKYDQKLYEASLECLTNEDFEEALLEIQAELFDDLSLCRLFFKDIAFDGEKEFRIVIILPQNDHSNIEDGIKRGFTSNHGIITPYIDVKIPQVSIKRITLSPMLERELAVEGLRRLLYYFNYDPKIDIVNSTIPLRY